MDWKKLDNDNLPRESIIFKRSSQVVVDETDYYLCCGWSVLVDVTSLTSFTLPFTIITPNYVKLLGFTNDEISLPIVEVPGPHQLANFVQVFNISTQTLQNLGIQGVAGSFFIGQYIESLILLPYPDRELLRLLELWFVKCLMNVVDAINISLFKDVTRVYRPKDIINDLNIEFNIDVSYKRAWKGKHLALKSNQEDLISSSTQLPYYCYNLKLANENTVTHIDIDHEGRFKMLFIAFGVAMRI
uniref:Transposase, MuDR, MULE transposase domain protein n=1 Tax=Tanacetum cinerariifolium TaxID=118510 RepID=A0A6L2L535_TANCI|nr:transposase, MuDR, MULE transposase domain protein [Tanacetum cinerariifolium]